MKDTLRIQKTIGRYKSHQRYKKIIEKLQPESIIHYKFIEMDVLRELAELKAESPTSFRVACALSKLIMN